MFHESGLENSLCQLFGQQGQVMAIYGDAAYPLHPYLVSPFSGMNRSADQVAFNSQMSPLWCSIEWGFRKIVATFAFLDFHKNQKLYLQPLGPYFQVGCLLANCHTCLYGSEVPIYLLWCATSNTWRIFELTEMQYFSAKRESNFYLQNTVVIQSQPYCVQLQSSCDLVQLWYNCSHIVNSCKIDVISQSCDTIAAVVCTAKTIYNDILLWCCCPYSDVSTVCVASN